jgi:hypothetical protein
MPLTHTLKATRQQDFSNSVIDLTPRGHINTQINKIVNNPRADHKQGSVTVDKNVTTVADDLLFASTTGRTT